MGRNKGESVQSNVKPVNKEIGKQQKDTKNRVVVGLVTSFACSHCEKAFAQKTSLTKHLKTHQQLSDETQGIKESIVKEPVGSKKEDSEAADKENLPDKKVPVLKPLKVMKTKRLANAKGSGSKSRLDVLRVSQVSSAMKSLISPASGGRGKVRKVLRKKSGSLQERPKLVAKEAITDNEERETTFHDVIDPKLSTKPETESVRNGSPGQSGLMCPGWHASAAGGVHRAVEAAARVGAQSFGLFLRPQRTWLAPPLKPGVADQFKALCAEHNFPPHLILPHGSYLVNLASPKPELREKSIALLVEEMVRCQELGLTLFNIHPGSTCGKLSRQEGIRLVAEGVNRVHKETRGSTVKVVLENMCCQGDTLGGDLEELKLIIEQVEDKERIGVCLDTCHAMAAGYDLSAPEGFERLCSEFETKIGWQWLVGVHVNDSLGPAGSHRDRHANIGQGMIGEEGFRRILNCPHFADLPLILETPPHKELLEDGYRREVELLKSLAMDSVRT